MLKRLVIITSILLSIACAKHSSDQMFDSRKAKSANHSPLNTVTPTKSNEGGFDTGGGNGVANRAFESYVFKNLTYTEEYKLKIEPILKKLELKLPYLSEELLKVFTKSRTWYLVPSELKPLENDLIHVPVKDKSQQLALHTPYSIWINSALYNGENTDIESRADLLLHEAVMALMVNKKFNDSKDSLTTADYESIRLLTDILKNKLQTFSAKELATLLRHHSFIDHSFAILPIPNTLKLSNAIETFRFLSDVNQGVLPNYNFLIPFYLNGETRELCKYKFETNKLTISSGSKVIDLSFIELLISLKQKDNWLLTIVDQSSKSIALNQEVNSLNFEIKGETIIKIGIQKLKRIANTNDPVKDFQKTIDPNYEIACTYLPSTSKL